MALLALAAPETQAAMGGRAEEEEVVVMVVVGGGGEWREGESGA